MITPNPKTSGGARWNYLAAWGYALEQVAAATRRRRSELVGGIYKNAPVLDTGARGSPTTFAERGIGDVLIAWENEALLAQRAARRGRVRDRRALAQHPGRAAGRRGRHGRAPQGHGDVAEAYLEYLYSPEAQELIGKHHYRPSDPTALAEVRGASSRSSSCSRSTRSSAAGRRRRRSTSPTAAIFDQIYQPGR